MKKLFTLIAALAITSIANAQLQFKHGSEPVENNAEVVTSHVNELIPGILYQIDSGIYLSSAKDAKVDLTAEPIDGNFEICAWGSCIPVPIPNPKADYQAKDILSSNDENLQIHETLKKDEIKTIKLKLTAQYTNDPSSKVSCTVIMTTDPEILAGIDGVEADNNAPAKTYNIGGRAANDGKGLVIIKKGNTVKKVVR